MDDSFSVVHDHPGGGNIAMNDYDPVPGPQNMQWQLVSGTSHGALLFDSTGVSVGYVPFEHYVGPDSFTYNVTDGGGVSNTATVNISVTNNAPVANDDPADGPYKFMWNSDMDAISAPGVLQNDTDPDGDAPLHAFLASNPAHGTVTLDQEGGFHYYPQTGFTGDDSFTYVANDGVANSAPATVSFKVVGIDLTIHDGQQGAAVSESQEVTRGAYTVANVNDTDGDGRMDIMDNLVSPASTTFGVVPHEYTTSLQVASTSGFSVNDRVRVTGPAGGVSFEDTHITAIQGNTVSILPGVSDGYPLGGTMLHPGRPEVDLMQLDLAKPSYIDSGFTNVQLTLPSFVKAYYFSDKTGIVLTQNGVATFPEDMLPMTLWVEIGTSTTLRDYHVDLAYPFSGGTAVDTVRATGVWAELTRVSHDRQSAAQLFADQNGWGAMENPVRGLVQDYDGTGLLPIVNSAHNGITLEWTVTPPRNPDPMVDGPWEADGVNFDGTRRVLRKAWSQAAADGQWTLLQVLPDVSYELPNDDSGNIDESGTLTRAPGVENRFYDYDAPGPDSFGTGNQAIIERLNAEEWLRMGIGARPSGNAISGSIVSDMVNWHVRHSLVDSAGVWVRTTGDSVESDSNDVGMDHVVIGDAP